MYTFGKKLLVFLLAFCASCAYLCGNTNVIIAEDCVTSYSSIEYSDFSDISSAEYAGTDF